MGHYKLKLLLCGYYGEDNLGDEALLGVLLQAVHSNYELIITGKIPLNLNYKAPQAIIVNRRSLLAVLHSVTKVDAIVFGGGSLLQDSTSFRSLVYYLAIIVLAKLLRRPVILWGQGLGPLKLSLSLRLVSCILPFCTAASWRDAASFNLASRLAPGLQMQMAPDPVWQLPQQSWQGGGSILLSWRPTPLLNKQRWRILLTALNLLANQLDVPVKWLAFHRHQDSYLLDDLVNKGLVTASLRERSITITPDCIEMVTNLAQRARLVIPMRLHALIISRLTCCPMVALSYDPKVEAAAVISEVPCISLTTLPDAEELYNQWSKQVDRPAKPELVDLIRKDSFSHGKVLNNLKLGR